MIESEKNNSILVCWLNSWAIFLPECRRKKSKESQTPQANVSDSETNEYGYCRMRCQKYVKTPTNMRKSVNNALHTFSNAVTIMDFCGLYQS